MWWYRRHQRELPWRETDDPYKIWVSEVMLQQTTVKTVLPYYQKWIREFPDVLTLSRAPVNKVLKLWEGLGYYQRAKNLCHAAQIIAGRHQGRLPPDYDLLITLPGFGPYTTAAVLSIAFGQPFPVVDANVKRVVMRILKLMSNSSRNNENKIEEFLKLNIDRAQPGLFNQAAMELGALICRPQNPACLLCPVSVFCTAYASGVQEIIPSPRKRDIHKIEAVTGLVKKGHRYFIQRRPQSGLLAGLWEFPGGKRQSGESLEDALKREIREETGMDVIQADPLITVRHAYTRFQVTLHAFTCRVRAFPAGLSSRQKWVSLEEMEPYPFPSGSVKIIRHLKGSE